MKRRHIIQALGFLALNGNLKGFVNGTIYTGKSKGICVPALNCYACPGALGSCPIGSLQAVSGNASFNLSYYVMGMIALFGILFGRLYCGYLCPFGFLQDLLHKIKSVKFKVPAYLGKLRYFFTIVFVFALPYFLQDKYGMSDPYFCKYICPSGTFFGAIPLLTVNPLLRESIGSLFYLKAGILLGVIVAAIFLYRPFCRMVCPLGALLGIFNPVSIYSLKIESNCIKCGKCQEACGFDIPTYIKPNSPECIRCDECIKVCPVNAIKRYISLPIPEDRKESAQI